MPFPPRGLEQEEHPLKHRVNYSFGLSGATATMNSTWVTIIRNSKSATEANAKTILVNPKNASQDVETGPLCTPMSIIRNMRIYISMMKTFSASSITFPFKISITPFFGAFPEKYDIADDDTGVTVASVMQLTKDATLEDIVPLTTNKLPLEGPGELPMPLSTVNDAEEYDTDYNMTTDATMEDTPFNMETLQSLFQHGSKNIQSTLRACLGRTMHFTLTKERLFRHLQFKNFLPSSVRRINPYTFFGLLFHLPIQTDLDSLNNHTTITASKIDVGFRCLIRYDEWNAHHDNTM